MKNIILLLACFLSLSMSSHAQAWNELGTGSSALNKEGNGIYSVCSDGRGNIYTAGWLYDTSFNQLVGKWDGTTWTYLGAGSSLLDSFLDVTQIIADTNGNVYAIGQIFNSTQQYVAKWDGISWSKVGTGAAALNANGDILAICFDRYGNLYAAGVFTDGITDTNGHPYVAKWDGTSWTQLGTGINALNANNVINTIFVDTSDNVYAAGVFTDSATYLGGNVYVAKWDGTSWSELGAGVAHQVYGYTQIFSILADTVGNVYAAGTQVLDSGYSYVAKWDGVSWSKLGSGIHALNANNSINSLCTDIYGNLYAAGSFTDGISDTSGFMYVAKWDGTTWSEVGAGSGALNANGEILSICSDAYGAIYATGEFTDTTTVLPNGFHPLYVAKYSAPLSVTPIHYVENIIVYPNPVHTILNISIEDVATNVKYTHYSLYDVLGKIYRTGNLQLRNTTVDISELSTGVYFLQIGNSQAIYKIVKE